MKEVEFMVCELSSAASRYDLQVVIERRCDAFGTTTFLAMKVDKIARAKGR